MPYNKQGELFNEFKIRDNSIKQITKNIMHRRRPHLHIFYVYLEQAVTIALLVIMGLIVSFALGVERGKKYMIIDLREVQKPAPVVSSETVQEPPKEDFKMEKADKAIDISKPYTIQLISYKKRELAEDKVEELKKVGLEADILERNSWYQVIVGAYVDRKSAEADFKKFSKIYKGCFLRNKYVE